MIDKETLDLITQKIGQETTEQVKKTVTEVESQLTKKYGDVLAGAMSQKAFDDWKAEKLAPLQTLISKLDDATKEQGKIINDLQKHTTPEQKSLETFIQEQFTKEDGLFKNLRASGKSIIIPGQQLKAAGVQSIAGTLPTPGAYVIGGGGPALDIFDFARNPNFIMNKVDVGRTDQATLLWANELATIQGAVSVDVAEGTLKPQVQHQFSVETSKAKKAAGWVELTEELEQDLPQFGTRVRRMLQEDVERGLDDGIQAALIAVAPAFGLTAQLGGKIQDANYWDALYSMMAQIGFNNFQLNSVAINWLTNVLVKTEKNANNTYLLPSFAGEIQSLMSYANKVAAGKALVGDLKQFHVDIYKDFQLKVGWINDELIFNKFAIVGEMRYHAYISDNRKKALCYDDLNTVSGILKPVTP